MRQEVARLEGLVNEHREHERNLRNTLLTAQRLADEVKDAANQPQGVATGWRFTPPLLAITWSHVRSRAANDYRRSLSAE